MTRTKAGNGIINDQELRDGRLVFYRNDLGRMDKVLEELVRLTQCKSVVMVDKEGHMITRVGQHGTYNADTISALVAGSFSATREMARILGEKEFTTLYHQGSEDSILLNLIGDRTILTILFDKSTTLGLVRIYADEASAKLEDLFREIGSRRVDEEVEGEGLEEGFGSSAKDTLDALFDLNS